MLTLAILSKVHTISTDPRYQQISTSTSPDPARSTAGAKRLRRSAQGGSNSSTDGQTASSASRARAIASDNGATAESQLSPQQPDRAQERRRKFAVLTQQSDTLDARVEAGIKRPFDVTEEIRRMRGERTWSLMANHPLLTLSNPVVIDSNIAVNFAVRGQRHHVQCRSLISHCIQHHIDFAAPHLFQAECDGFFRGLVFDGRLTQDAADVAGLFLDAVEPALLHYPATRIRAREIALPYNQDRCYDATYAALAEILQCQFWTADYRFYSAVRHDLRSVRHIDLWQLLPRRAAR